MQLAAGPAAEKGPLADYFKSVTARQTEKGINYDYQVVTGSAWTGAATEPARVRGT